MKLHHKVGLQVITRYQYDLQSMKTEESN